MGLAKRKNTKCFIRRISFAPSQGECVCVCVGYGPSKMLFPNCKRSKRHHQPNLLHAISRERERENTGLVLRFLLAGRQAPPPRNAVVWWVRLTAPALHEETSPQKGNLFATEERENLCGKWSTQPEKLQNESQRFPFSTTARGSKQRRGIAARPSIAMDTKRYNQVPQFVGLETPAFRAPQTPCHASTRPHASTQVHFVCYEFLQVWRRRADGYRTSRDYPMIGVLEQINQVPRFVGLETVAFRAPQTPCHAITMPHASSQVGPHHRVTSAQLLLF